MKVSKTPGRVVRRTIKPGPMLRGVAVGDPSKNDSESLAKKRKMLADFCRVLEEQATGRAGLVPIPKPPSVRTDPRFQGLAPRLKQTLLRMLAGDSEKQVAIHLGISPHTVHVYVRSLYKHFNASGRSELLALFVEKFEDA